MSHLCHIFVRSFSARIASFSRREVMCFSMQQNWKSQGRHRATHSHTVIPSYHHTVIHRKKSTLERIHTSHFTLRTPETKLLAVRYRLQYNRSHPSLDFSDFSDFSDWPDWTIGSSFFTIWRSYIICQTPWNQLLNQLLKQNGPPPPLEREKMWKRWKRRYSCNWSSHPTDLAFLITII